MSLTRRSDALLLTFVKAPRPGEVKTRLGPQLTPTQAGELYRALVEDQLARVGSGAEFDQCLLIDPADAAPMMEEWLGHDRPLYPQATGDLGRRMDAAFAWGFSLGYRRVLAVGSDLPTLGRLDILTAIECLRDHDRAISPALDGGYSLLGLVRPEPELFREVPWSTPQVLATTLTRADSAGGRTCILPVLPDIDTFRDLDQLWRTQRSRLAADSPRTMEQLRRIFPPPEGGTHD